MLRIFFNGKRSTMPSISQKVSQSLRATFSASALFFVSVLLLALLSGCSPMKYTVDDGRTLDPVLLAKIKNYGDAHKALRPAIAKSAQVVDDKISCSKQWDIPFSVATSYDMSSEDDRVAWVRMLKVDERLTVVGAAPETGLMLGDKIVNLDGFKRENALKMLEELQSLQLDGDPFNVETSEGKKLTIKPVKLCRGYVDIAPLDEPYKQDIHWLKVVHPLEVFRDPLTSDEALWLVLWTQGISEEAGGRMRTYSFGVGLAKTAINLAALASGVGAAAQQAQAATAAANAAAQSAAQSAASSAAANAAQQAAVKALAEQLAKQAAENYAKDIANSAFEYSKKQVGDALQTAAANRFGFGGLGFVAGTAYDLADAWAAQKMVKLGFDPIAGLSLHFKLIKAGALNNVFVFDEDRLEAYKLIMAELGYADGVSALLDSIKYKEDTTPITEPTNVEAETIPVTPES
jgi:hypothetical protein